MPTPICFTLLVMWMRTALGLWSAALLLLAAGCMPVAEEPIDDQNNHYYRTGKRLVEARDYQGAIQAFQKALELNPRSVLSHYELAVLYEQHSKQTEADYIAAMYHYQQVLNLRPKGYPRDLAEQRLTACKQEFVKTQSLARMAGAMVTEHDKLRRENAALRQQLAAWQRFYASLSGQNPTDPAGTSDTTTQPPAPESAAAQPSPTRSAAQTVRPTPPSRPGRATASAPRRHVVMPGETFYSISRRYGVSVQALKAANPGINERRLKVGTALRIPER